MRKESFSGVGIIVAFLALCGFRSGIFFPVVQILEWSIYDE